MAGDWLSWLLLQVLGNTRFGCGLADLSRPAYLERFPDALAPGGAGLIWRAAARVRQPDTRAGIGEGPPRCVGALSTCAANGDLKIPDGNLAAKRLQDPA